MRSAPLPEGRLWSDGFKTSRELLSPKCKTLVFSYRSDAPGIVILNQVGKQSTGSAPEIPDGRWALGSDPWNHQFKHWQDVLDAARKRGWPTPIKAKNHGGVTLNCPKGDPMCGTRIFSTGRGSERVAIQMLRKVKQCPHGNFTVRYDQINAQLDVVERLLRAALLEIERRDREVVANELLDLVAESIDMAVDEIAELEREYSQVADEESALSGELDEALTEGENAEPVELIGEVGKTLRRVEIDLRDLPSRDERHSAAKLRLEDATAERDRLRGLV